MDSGTTVDLDPETMDRLAKLAEGRGSAPRLLVKEAVEQYVDREEKRQSFHDDARKAWEDYRRDGLHLTEAEMDAWFDRIEAGEDVDPPKCHD